MSPPQWRRVRLRSIWYVDFRRITIGEFRANLPGLQEASGIVFDLRGYPTQDVSQILQHLIAEPKMSPIWQVPAVTRPDRIGLRFVRRRRSRQPTEPYLAAPKAIITDGSAISYAETILGIFEAYDLATIVGEPTAGTNGNVNRTSLPGGYQVVWTGMRVLKHDESQHHGIGILPDVPVERTRAIEVVRGR